MNEDITKISKEAAELFRESMQTTDKDKKKELLLKFIQLNKDQNVFKESFHSDSNIFEDSFKIENIFEFQESLQILQQLDPDTYNSLQVYKDFKEYKEEMTRLMRCEPINVVDVVFVMETQVIKNNVKSPEAIKEFLDREDCLDEMNLKLFIGVFSSNIQLIETTLTDLIDNLTNMVQNNSINIDLTNKLVNKINYITLVKDNIKEILACKTYTRTIDLKLKEKNPPLTLETILQNRELQQNKESLRVESIINDMSLEAGSLFWNSMQTTDKDKKKELLLKFIELTKEPAVLKQIFTDKDRSMFINKNTPNISSCQESLQILQEQSSAQEQSSVNFSISNMYKNLLIFNANKFNADSESTLACLLANELIKNNVKSPEDIKEFLDQKKLLDEFNLKWFVSLYKSDNQSIEKILNEIISNLTTMATNKSINPDFAEKLIEKINSITIVQDNIKEIQACQTKTAKMMLILEAKNPPLTLETILQNRENRQQQSPQQQTLVQPTPKLESQQLDNTSKQLYEPTKQEISQARTKSIDI